MFWRIRVDAAFLDLPPVPYLQDILTYFQNHALTINPGTEGEERGFVSLEKCYHDEDPTIPCDLIEHHQTP